MQLSAGEIAQFARIFDAPTNDNIRSLTPGEFPKFIFYLFERDGLYRPVYVDGPGDGGVDIELRVQDSSNPILVGVVQCKRYYTTKVQANDIGYFANVAKHANTDHRLFFTTTGYTPSAYREARHNDILLSDPLGIRLWILDIRRREANHGMMIDLPNKDAIPAPIICVANNKGGIGKTSLVANIAAAMAEMGKHVLVIDTDPQANLTKWLHPTRYEPSDHMLTIYAVLAHEHPIYPLVVRRTTLPGVMLLPAHRELYRLPPNWGHQQERHLLQALSATPLSDLHADIILIDTQPALYSLTRAAIIAAHYVLFPFRPDEPSDSAVGNLLDFVLSVEASHVLPPLRVLGGVATCVDNTRLAIEMREIIRQNVLKHALTQRSGLTSLSFWLGDTRAREVYPRAEHEHTSVLALRSRPATDDINKIATEVLSRVNGYPVSDSE